MKRRDFLKKLMAVPAAISAVGAAAFLPAVVAKVSRQPVEPDLEPTRRSNEAHLNKLLNDTEALKRMLGNV